MFALLGVVQDCPVASRAFPRSARAPESSAGATGAVFIRRLAESEFGLTEGELSELVIFRHTAFPILQGSFRSHLAFG